MKKLNKILKVQKLSHFSYLLHGILETTDDRNDIFPTDLIFKNYFSYYNPADSVMVGQWFDLGFELSFKYIPVTFNDPYYQEDLDHQSQFVSKITSKDPRPVLHLATNSDFENLLINDIRLPRRSFLYDADRERTLQFDIINLNYLENSILRCLSCMESKSGYYLNAINNDFLKYLQQFDKKTVLLNFSIQAKIANFIDGYTIDPVYDSVIKVFKTFAPLLFVANTLADIGTIEVQKGLRQSDHLVEKYKLAEIESYNNNIPTEQFEHLDDIVKTFTVDESFIEIYNYKDTIVKESADIQSGVSTLIDAIDQFLYNEEKLLKHLQIN